MKMRNRNGTYFLIVVAMLMITVIAIAGCGAGNSYSLEERAPSMETQDSAGSAPAMEPGRVVATKYNEMANNEEQASNISSERKLIENISMTLVVEDVGVAFQHITDMTKQMQGFVQDSRKWQSNQKQHGYLTVRIPVERLSGSLSEIESLGEAKDSHTNTQDVTEEYFDREARLRNLEKQEQRYLEILAEAKTTEDVLNVERELVRIREQIEVFMGQLKYFDHQIQYATIYIQLEEEKTIVEYAKPSFAKAFEAAGKAVYNSINLILTALTMLIIAAGYLLPLLPVILVILYILYRKVYRKRMNVSKKDSKEPESNEGNEIDS